MYRHYILFTFHLYYIYLLFHYHFRAFHITTIEIILLHRVYRPQTLSIFHFFISLLSFLPHIYHFTPPHNTPYWESSIAEAKLEPLPLSIFSIYNIYMFNCLFNSFIYVSFSSAFIIISLCISLFIELRCHYL